MAVIAMRMVVFVVVPIVMVMAVVMIVMIIVGGCISAPLRLKRCMDLSYFGAETLEQRFNRGIALEPKPALQNLHRYMAVPKMPSKAGKRWQISPPHLKQSLGLRHDLNKVAIVQY
jgi:hypothetical protein